MLDGAIFSGLSQFGPPGYLDGHEGVWMAPREVTYDYAKTFWDAGFQLHAHANGDAAAGWFIDLLGTLLRESPRSDHRMTLEHFAYSTRHWGPSFQRIRIITTFFQSFTPRAG